MKTQEKIMKGKIAEFCYLAALAICIFAQQGQRLNYQVDVGRWLTLLRQSLYLAGALFLVKIVLTFREHYKEYLFGALCAVILWISRRQCGNDTMLFMGICMMCCPGVSTRKILWVYLILGFVFLPGSALLAHFGVLKEYLVDSSGNVSWAAGWGHPNTLAGFLMSWLLVVWYLFVADRKLYWSFLTFWAAAALIYLLTDCRTVTIVLSAAPVVWAAFRSKIVKEDGQIRKCMALIPVFFFAASVLLVLIWKQGQFTGSTLWSRCRLALTGIERYGLHLFGSQVTMVGTQLHAETGAPYFTLDMACFHSLIIYGILPTLWLLGFSTEAAYLSALKKNDKMLLILFLLYLYGVSEANLLYFTFNFTWACLAEGGTAFPKLSRRRV